MNVLAVLNILSLAGIFVFAVSGALSALRKGSDIVGVSFIAAVTGVGGGTMRDVLLGDLPVSWVTDPTAIVICVIAAIGTAALNRFIIGRRETGLLWADAVGLALFAVLGAAKAAELGAHPLVVILFGAISATFGGLIRDILCGEVPVLFRQDIYITAALAGAAVFVVLPDGMGFEVRVTIACLAGFLLRAGAMLFRWRMPRIRVSVG